MRYAKWFILFLTVVMCSAVWPRGGGRYDFEPWWVRSGSVWTLMGGAGTTFGIGSSLSLTGNLTMGEDKWVGIGSSSERIVFDGSGNYISVSGANFHLADDTTTANAGSLFQNGSRLMHTFHHPSGGGAIPTGENLFIGKNAGNFTAGSTATSVNDSSWNIGIGTQSLVDLTIGSNNVGLGYRSLYELTEGLNAVGVGSSALLNLTTGDNDTGVGRYAMRYLTTGNRNTSVGANSLYNLTDTNDNSGFGFDAGRYIAGGSSSNTGAINSLYLGARTKASATGRTNEIVIGRGATGYGSNTIQLGDPNITDVNTSGAVRSTDLILSGGPWIDIRSYGAVGDGVTDDTSAFQDAFDALAGGQTLLIPGGDYVITDTLTITYKSGFSIVGTGVAAYTGTVGSSRLVWEGGNAKPVVECDWASHADVGNLVIKCADADANSATACWLFKKTSYSSNKRVRFHDCRFTNAAVGIGLGDSSYDNTWDASQMLIEKCYFDCGIGIYSAGVAAGSQMVLNRVVASHFQNYSGLAIAGVWLEGGNISVNGCTFWAGSDSLTRPYTCVYMAGDRSFTLPTVIRDSYCEHANYFFRTEWTDNTTGWSRTGIVNLVDNYMDCDRTTVPTTITTTAGNTSATVADANYIFEGIRITIAGVSGRMRVTDITGTTVTLDPAPDASVSDANATVVDEAVMVFKDVALNMQGNWLNAPVHYSPPPSNASYANSATSTLTVGSNNRGLMGRLELGRAGSVSGLGRQVTDYTATDTQFTDFLTFGSRKQTYSTAAPSPTGARDATWSIGDVVWDSVPTEGAPVGWVNLAAGTCGSASAITTGGIASGSVNLTVASTDDLSRGMYINIAGVTGDKRIVAITDSVVELDSASDATVAAADVTRAVVDFRGFGLVLDASGNFVSPNIVLGDDEWIGESDTTSRIVMDTTADPNSFTMHKAQWVVAPSTAITTTGVLGSELVTNGTFASDLTGWTGEGATKWRWQAGVADHNEASSDSTALAQNISVTSGQTYHVAFTISGRSAGTVTVTLGAVTLINEGAGTTFSTDATYNRSIVAGATGSVALSFTPSTTFDGALDNISVKLISPSTAVTVWKDDSGDSAVEIRGDAGLYNQFIGLNSGQMNTTGTSNSFFGQSAGYSNTTGSKNSFFGLYAGYSNTTGSNNSFFGQSAGYSNTTGSSNSFFGQSAGRSNTTGSSNSFFGLYAGYSNTTGSSNSFFGLYAGYSNTTGSNNSFVGYQAGRYQADGTTALTTAASSIYIGYNARGKDNSDSYSISIGRDAIGKGANTTVIGTAGTTTATYLYGNINVGNVAYTGLPVNAVMLADGNEPLTCTNASGIVSKSGELYAFDAGGTDQLLTNDEEEIYYDEAKGAYIPAAVIKRNRFAGIEQRIDLFALAKAVEELTGKPGSIITTKAIATENWDAEQAKIIAEKQAEIDLLTAAVATLTAQIADANDAEVAELTARKNAIKIPATPKAVAEPVWVGKVRAAMKK